VHQKGPEWQHLPKAEGEGAQGGFKAEAHSAPLTA